MAADISPTTGFLYYSGTWEQVRNVLRVLNIGEGKLATVTQEMVNEYQETVDREIDAILEPLYIPPIRATNRVQPDGTTKEVFPGDVRRHARYWVAALMLLNQFQGLSQNVNDQGTSYLEDARRSIFAIVRFNHRIPGQEMRSHISRTMPPTLQPAAIPEPAF